MANPFDQFDQQNPFDQFSDGSVAQLQREQAQETTPGQAYAIGMGRMGDRILEGLKQGGMGIGAILSELLPDRMKQAAQDALAKNLMAQQADQADQTARYKPLQEAHPIATTAGEATTLMASPMVRVVDAPGALAAATNAATSAALPSLAEYGTAEERGQRGAIAAGAGALGSLAVSAAGKVLKPVTSLLTPEQQRLATVAQDIGIPLTAGDKTGNKFLKTTEAVMQELPATSGPQTAIQQAKRDALTKAVMQRLGQDSGEFTPDTVLAARRTIGSNFDRIFSKVDVPVGGPDTMNALGNIVQDANANLVPEQARLVQNRVNQLIDKVSEDGTVSGPAYQAWRSEVQKQAQSAGGFLGDKLRKVYRAVDQAAYDAANQVGEAGNLAAARGQYRDLLAVEPLLNRSSDGLVPSGFQAAVKGATPAMQEIARVGKQFVSDQVGNPGTAQRLMAQKLITGGALGLGAGGVTYGITQDPEEALKAALMSGTAGIVLPRIAQGAINSGVGQRYLTQGFGRPLTPIEQALIDRAVQVGAISSSRALVPQ